MYHFDVAIIGGDFRQSYMIPYLIEKGYTVICYGVPNIPEDVSCDYAKSLKEAVENADIVVGGLPFSKGETICSNMILPDLQISVLCDYLKPHQKLFGGVLPRQVRDYCDKNQIACYDFIEDEALTIFNAIATAEGTILEAIRHQPSNLHGSKSLVLGYGKCGRVLADKLKGLSAEVTVCARSKEAQAFANAAGMRSLPFEALTEEIKTYEYIFNSIPEAVLTKGILKNVQKNALIIDIASGGGVDFAAARELGIQARLCPGLPGKYAPRISAGELVRFLASHK